MPVTARCPGCGTTYANIKDELVGKSVKCKKCQQSFVIRGGAAAAKAAPSATRPGKPPAISAPIKPPARKPPPPPEPEPEPVAVVENEEEDGEKGERDRGPTRPRKKKSSVPRVAPISAFGLFFCCFGYLWTIISYFQACGGLNRLDPRLNLQAWTLFIPIYSNLYMSTVIKGINKVIKDNDLDVDRVSDNIVLNFLLPFIPLFNIFKGYNAVADAMGR